MAATHVDTLTFKLNIRMRKKVNLSGFERGIVGGARQADLSMSETTDFEGFSHTTTSRV